MNLVWFTRTEHFLLLMVLLVLFSTGTLADDSIPKFSEALETDIVIRLEGGASSDHYANLIKNLKERGLINFSPHKLSSPNVSTEVMEGGFSPGPYYSTTLDETLCAANPHVCTVGKDHFIRWTTKQSAQYAEVGSQGVDGDCRQANLLPKNTVCLPDITLKSYLSTQIFPFTAQKGKTLEQMVVSILRGCKTFDDECKDVILFLNAPRGVNDPFASTFDGTLRLPVKGYKFVLRSPHPDEVKEVIKNTISEVEKKTEKTGIGKNVFFGIVQPGFRPQATTSLQAASPSQEGGLRHQMIDTSDISSFHDRLSRIGWPKDTNKLRVKTPTKLFVGVIDHFFDSSHCGMARTHIFDLPSLDKIAPPKQIERQKACDTKRSTDAFYDHGSHVAGIITTVLSSAGQLGMNADASIYGYQITDKRMLGESSGVDDIVLRARGKGINYVPVFLVAQARANEQNIPLIKELMHQEGKSYEETVLFVVSAGNMKKPLSEGECMVFPACWNNTSIVSVAALKTNGEERLEKSNFGHKVDIAAVGEDWFSTAYANSFGYMSGTSQAAAVVAGQASLIYSKLPGNKLISPWQMKNWILTTGDLTSDLSDIAKFGRVHIERSLHVEGELKYRNTMCNSPCQALNFKPLKNRWPSEVTINLQEGGYYPISSGSIRRITFDPASAQHTVYYVVRKVYRGTTQKGEGALEVVTGSFKSHDQLAVFSIPGKEKPIKVEFQDILEYICPFPCD